MGKLFFFLIQIITTRLTILDIRDSDGTLSNVSGQNDLPHTKFRLEKHFRLFIRGDGGMEYQEVESVDKEREVREGWREGERKRFSVF